MKKAGNHRTEYFRSISESYIESMILVFNSTLTPLILRDDNKIVLFVTEEKQASAEQYADRLSGNTLDWDGPTDHFAEDRMLNSASSSDEIHLFHRERHHTDFTYCGRLSVSSHVHSTDRPSHFKFKII